MEFIKAFEEIDTDESGEITRGELEDYMKSKNYKPAFVEKWLRIFDADNSGTITLEEFCNTLGLIPGKKQKERIQRRNTLKLIQLEKETPSQTDSSDDKNKTNVNHTTTVNESITVSIKTNSKDNGKDDDKLLNDGSNENSNTISTTEEIYTLSKSIDKDEIDKISKTPKIRKINNTQNLEEISEDIKTTYIKNQIIGENDEVKIIAEDPDISDGLRGYVLKLSLDSARMYNDPKEMARNVKTKLDFTFNRTWHVIAGRDSYGCLVTHEEGKFIHVRAREWGILMWQIHSKS